MPRLSPPVSKMSPQYFIRFGQNVPVSMHKLVPLVSWKKYIQPPKIHERDKKRTFYIFTKSAPASLSRVCQEPATRTIEGVSACSIVPQSVPPSQTA